MLLRRPCFEIFDGLAFLIDLVLFKIDGFRNCPCLRLDRFLQLHGLFQTAAEQRQFHAHLYEHHLLGEQVGQGQKRFDAFVPLLELLNVSRQIPTVRPPRVNLTGFWVPLNKDGKFLRRDFSLNFDHGAGAIREGCIGDVQRGREFLFLLNDGLGQRLVPFFIRGHLTGPRQVALLLGFVPCPRSINDFAPSFDGVCDECDAI